MSSYRAILGENTSARMNEGQVVYDVPLILTMTSDEYSEFVTKVKTGNIKVMVERPNE